MNNICFNERQDVWTTKYDWNPTVSENINGTFFSIGGSNADDVSNTKIWSHDVTKAKPTVWFDEQHPFEFEFVVNDPQGVHKIIENLQIMSNNVQPEQLTFEIIGDSYFFNKERIMHLDRDGDKEDFTDGRIQSNITNKDDYLIPEKTPKEVEKVTISDWIKNKSQIKHFTGLTWDQMLEQVPELKRNQRTGQIHMVIPQECRNIETFGRRLGNIQYKEDSWYTTVEPIIHDVIINNLEATNNKIIAGSGTYKSTRIRDKWVKIRVRYTGEDLAIITAIRTIMNV